MEQNEPKLVRYDAMCSAIQAAHSVDEAKEIRDAAVALAAYAKEAKNRENERKCCEIRIRAERRTGELLRETAKTGERHSGHGDQKSESQRATPKLSDHGISKDQSADWQKLAAIPEKRFEAELKKPGVPSTHQILERAERSRIKHEFPPAYLGDKVIKLVRHAIRTEREYAPENMRTVFDNYVADHLAAIVKELRITAPKTIDIKTQASVSPTEKTS